MKLVIHNIKYKLQQGFHKLGWHVARYHPAKAEHDPILIQKRLLSTNADTIFDVGAWVGKSTLRYLDTFPEASIHAFEPFPDSFNRFLETTSELSSKIIPNQLALSDSVGRSTFRSNKIETTNSLLPSTDTGSSQDFFRDEVKTIDVETTTLDAYCAQRNINQIDILKLDTQGSELSVLTGAKNMIAGNSINLIYCEVSFTRMYKGSALYHDIAIFLEKSGYELHGLYGLVCNESGRLMWGDAIFRRMS